MPEDKASQARSNTFIKTVKCKLHSNTQDCWGERVAGLSAIAGLQLPPNFYLVLGFCFLLSSTRRDRNEPISFSFAWAPEGVLAGAAWLKGRLQETSETSLAWTLMASIAYHSHAAHTTLLQHQISPASSHHYLSAGRFCPKANSGHQRLLMQTVLVTCTDPYGGPLTISYALFHLIVTTALWEKCHY